MKVYRLLTENCKLSMATLIQFKLPNMDQTNWLNKSLRLLRNTTTSSKFLMRYDTCMDACCLRSIGDVHKHPLHNKQVCLTVLWKGVLQFALTRRHNTGDTGAILTRSLAAYVGSARDTMPESVNKLIPFVRALTMQSRSPNFYPPPDLVL